MKFQGAFNSMFKTITARHRVYKYQNKKNNDKQLNSIPIYNDIFMSGTHGVAGCVCVWGGDGWVSVDRRLFRCCGVWVALELSCLETLLSWGSRVPVSIFFMMKFTS